MIISKTIHFIPVGLTGGLRDRDVLLSSQPGKEWVQARGWTERAGDHGAPRSLHPSSHYPPHLSWQIWIFTADVRVCENTHCNVFFCGIHHPAWEEDFSVSPPCSSLSNNCNQGEQKCDSCDNKFLEKSQSSVLLMY